MTLACPDEASHLFAVPRYDALRATLGEEVLARVLAHVDRVVPAPPEPAADVILTCDAGSASPSRRVVVAREAVGAFCSPGYAAVPADIRGGSVTG